jgi:hypothetical protein
MESNFKKNFPWHLPASRLPAERDPRMAHLPASAPGALTLCPPNLFSPAQSILCGATATPSPVPPPSVPRPPLSSPPACPPLSLSLPPRRHEQPPHGKRPPTPPPRSPLPSALSSPAARRDPPRELEIWSRPVGAARSSPHGDRRRSHRLARGAGGSGGGVVGGRRDRLSRAGRNAGRAVEGTRPGFLGYVR